MKGIDGYRSIRQYVFTRLVTDGYTRRIIDDLEVLGIPRKKAQNCYWKYKRDFIKKLNPDGW